MSLFILCGPSGVGKSTLSNALLQQRSDLTLSISHTTRLPRGKEVHGEDYYFVDEDTFKQMAQNNEFAEYAKVHDHYYGTSIAEIQHIQENHQSILFDINYEGAQQLRARFDDTISVLIFPPSISTLRQRLEARNTDSQTVIEKRIDIATYELQQWPDFDYVLKNNDLEQSIHDLIAIYDASKFSTKTNLTWLQTNFPK